MTKLRWVLLVLVFLLPALVFGAAATSVGGQQGTAGGNTVGGAFTGAGAACVPYEGGGLMVCGAAMTFSGTLLSVPAITDQSANPADAGFIRMGNNINIAWEKAVAGTDWTLGVNASDVLTTNAPFAAPSVTLSSFAKLTPTAAPPAACAAGTEGEVYSDTSHAFCWCDGTTWQKLSGAGTCS